MTASAGIPKWLPLAIALALGACAGGNPPDTPPPPPQRSLADVMGTDANGTQSLDSLRDAAQRAPDNPTAQQLYGNAAERAARYPEALAAIDQAIAVGGATPARLLAQGRIALEAGDMPAATRAYSQILRQDSVNIDALNGLGIADDIQHHHDQAREQYRTALKLQPGDWRVRSNLAMSLLMSGSANEAASALAGAERPNTAPRRARHDLALALVAAGKREQAIRVLRIDMPAAEADSLADEFAPFARWLASPEGIPPPIR